MEKLSFSLVSDKKKSKIDISISQYFFWIGFGGILIIIGINYLSKKYMNTHFQDSEIFSYLLFGFLISFTIGISYSLFDSNGNNKIQKGFITFDENEITINHVTVYNLTDIEYIKFKGHDYKGSFINHYSDGDPFRSYGGDNFVEFYHLNKKYKFQFVVNSAAHRKRLNERLIPKMKMKTKIEY